MRTRRIRKKIKKIEREAIEFHTTFKKEFKRHLGNFITGALAFIAALLWRDAINKSLAGLKLGEGILAAYLTAFLISAIAVFGIILVTKFLKNNSDANQ